MHKWRENGKATQRYQEIHIFFSKLMILCMMEFVVLQWPLTFTLIWSIIENNNNDFKLQSSAVYVSYLAIAFDSMINPLWLSFASFKRKQKRKNRNLYFLQSTKE